MRPDAALTNDVVRLVLGVARLGEEDLRGWWKGHAMDRIGQFVLSGMFRRTCKTAALEMDVAAASRMHRELLGRSSALHLFSDQLPFQRWTDGWLAEQKTATNLDPVLTTLQNWTGEDAAETLRSWCGTAEPSQAEPLGDGLLLGRLSPLEVDDPPTLHQLARLLTVAYLDQCGPLRPPYFDLAR